MPGILWVFLIMQYSGAHPSKIARIPGKIITTSVYYGGPMAAGAPFERVLFVTAHSR